MTRRRSTPGTCTAWPGCSPTRSSSGRCATRAPSRPACTTGSASPGPPGCGTGCARPPRWSGAGPGSGDRFLLCRYEDVVTDPEPVLRELFDWLGEPWLPQVLAFHEVHQARGTAAEVEGRTRSDEPLDPARIARWTDSVDGRLSGLLRRDTAVLAGMLGYDLDDPVPCRPLQRHPDPAYGRRHDAGRVDVPDPRHRLVEAAPADVGEPADAREGPEAAAGQGRQRCGGCGVPRVGSVRRPGYAGWRAGCPRRCGAGVVRCCGRCGTADELCVSGRRRFSRRRWCRRGGTAGSPPTALSHPWS